MSIRRILLPIPGNSNPVEEIQLALSAATYLDAHVVALFISEPVSTPALQHAGAVAEFSRSLPPQDTFREGELADAGERVMRDMQDQFKRACGSNHIPLIKSGATIDTFPSARWEETSGDYSVIAVKRASSYDLVVAGSRVMGASLKEVAEASLLQTGRPVLLAPLSKGRALNETALIGWKDSPQCWHAVSAAIPFLQRARAVRIATVGLEGRSLEFAHKDVIEYLQCHGVTATSRVLEARGKSVGEMLLVEASDQNAGLLVMGAYSHSRLRDYFIGGVTKYVLSNAAATAVLLAH